MKTLIAAMLAAASLITPALAQESELKFQGTITFSRPVVGCDTIPYAKRLGYCWYWSGPISAFGWTSETRALSQTGNRKKAANMDKLLKPLTVAALSAAMVVPVAAETSILRSLPSAVQKEIQEVRESCPADEKNTSGDDGLQTFTVSGAQAVLVDSLNFCGGQQTCFHGINCAVHRIIGAVDSILVDFHNQRLHSVFAKPYDSEAKRVHRAVATGQLIIDVLAQTGEDADHPAANVRIGIDTGKALAVNNGRRGHREPLFLGEPANHAAKRAAGGSVRGIYLTNKARKAIGLNEVANVDTTPLTKAEIEASQKEAKLSVTVDQIVSEWREDLKKNPIGAFEFKGHTPPFATLDIEELSVRNSRRQDAATVYADLDGFTAYVGTHIGTEIGAKHVVRTLHVLRSELDAVLHEDFRGRKVRFIGDCVHGLLVEGTAQTTDVKETISNMTLCAAAMRSSFDVAVRRLRDNGTDTSGLGLAVGFEYGPMTVTRLGIKGELIRCSVSRGVLTAESEQSRCEGTQTAIGITAYDNCTHGVHAIFGDMRITSDLDYDKAVDQMAGKDDKTARVAKAMAASSLLKPASAAAAPLSFPNRPAGPAKPGGFA